MTLAAIIWLRGTTVDVVDKFIPQRLLKLLVHPKLHHFVGLERIEAIGVWIDNNFMLKRRQKATAGQKTRQGTKEYLQTHFCSKPFCSLETQPTGLAYVCCSSWLPTPIGKLETEPLKLWNSDAAVKIRESIVDGSFRFCNHVHCPAISDRRLMPRDAPQARDLVAQFKAGSVPLPIDVSLSHDKSCNLSCPSCRATTYLANSKRQASLDRLTETTLLPLLKNAKTVSVTGSGDPFGSKHFRNLLKRLTSDEFPGLKVALVSNGQLLDARTWSDLRLKNRVDNIEISIDAAHPRTYAIVRRGGTFERLLINLAFLRDLRRGGEIPHLQYSMVVQAMNYKEMPEFVHLCENYAADLIYFNMIRQRDIFSKDEYTASFIGSPQHPEYEQFLKVLEAPELQQPNVIIGNVREYARPREHQLN